MITNDDLQVFGSVVKNNSTRITITTSVWRDKTYVDIREYYSTEEEPDTWLPTKKGLRLAKNLLPQLLTIINKIS